MAEVFAGPCSWHGKRYRTECRTCVTAQTRCSIHLHDSRSTCGVCAAAAQLRIRLLAARLDALRRRAEARRAAAERQFAERVRRAYDRELLGTLKTPRKKKPKSTAESLRQAEHDARLAHHDPALAWAPVQK